MYFLSGMGALVFENVWFNQIGLIVGNSVWSAALVVAAFMAGLALGNAAAVALARRWSNLVRGYGWLEALAGISGAVVVLVFPFLPILFRPVLAPFLDHTLALNFARLGIAFALMVIPAIALGTTLPLLAKPLEAATGNYGFALGRLYGVNTLGAVAGTLLAEIVLVPAVGIRSSGLFAAACNLAAAFIALRIARDPAFGNSRPGKWSARALATPDAGRILAAALLGGGILLALEVVWFRFLLLYYSGTSLMFATMLAVVLAGIGCGGVIAAWWSRRGWSSGEVARIAAAAAAIGIVAGYAGFRGALDRMAMLPVAPATLQTAVSIFLMGPVCLLSGILFTALGDQLRSRAADAATATGALTLANTVGAMAGSLLAAFILLPFLGIEDSLFALAVLYGAIVFVLPRPGKVGPWRRVAEVAAAVIVLALFPFGTIDTHYRNVAHAYGARLAAAREGLAETVLYLSHEFQGQPRYHRLVTNSNSMSTTHVFSQRYMKLFAYLPAAFHPRIERALVICFGVGSTASAVADLPDVKAIDVVDVSRDILEMSDIAFRDGRRHPLRDGRVNARVEDGRFFLLQTDRTYDLITGEPPPPKVAGVVSLYTREHFRLMHDRLNPGGIATYWLPATQLLPRETLAIIAAFCAEFADCSLWSGMGMDWLLMGSRGGIAPVSREHFSRLWREPRTREELRRIAVDTPAQLLALFMADAGVLRQAAALVPPLIDNYPRRLGSEFISPGVIPAYAGLMHADASRRILESSPWLSERLPPALIRESARHFAPRWMMDTLWYPELRPPGYNVWRNAAQLMRQTDSVTWTRWLLNSEARQLEIAQAGDPADPLAAEHLAIDALVSRRKPGTGMTKERFLRLTPKGQVVTIFHHCLAGTRARARSMMDWIPEQRRTEHPFAEFLSWAAAECTAAARPPRGS